MFTFPSLFRATLVLCVLSFLWSCSSTQSTTGTKTSAPPVAAPSPNKAVQQHIERVEPGKAREYYIQGSILQMQKRYAEAIIEFQQALRYDNSSALHYALGYNYAELSKSELAIEHLQQAINLEPNFTAAYDLLGELYVRMFRLEEAIGIYERLLQIEPSDLTRFTLARIYEFYDPEKAIEIYNAMLEDSENYPIIERLAELYEKRGETDKAIALLERLYKTMPDNESIPPVLMQRYIQASDYESGFELLESVSHTLPADVVPRYYVAFGNALLEALDSTISVSGHAARYIEETGETFGDDWRVQLIRGMIAFSLHDTSLSERIFTRALTLADTMPEVPLQVAIFYMQQQYYVGVEHVTKKYEERFSQDARYPFFAALALSRLQRQDEAILALRRTLAIDSAYVEAWVQLGIEYSTMGETRLSDSAYARALVLDPKNALANNNYAYSLSERGEQLEEAKRMAETALRTDPDNPSYLDTMGWIYFQLGNYEQAREYVRRAIDNGDASATVYEHLGDVYEKLGDTDEAIRMWEKSLEKEPGRDSARQRINTHK
jgi:tetratricopeptide (TPR) repeat protein